MPAPARILELTDRFGYNLESYKKGNYNETQVRREFIDPFFEELGWDVGNKKGHSEAYKDVIHEDAIKVGGVTKAPDYCFRIGGTRKFFLEAKKPSVNIKEDTHPSYQLRRYAWSAKLPLSILTDFEEFAVYDCRVKPAQTDKPSHSRILYLNYTDYIDKWDEITGIFSREAILKGAFDKYVESKKAKKGTTEVDTAFLQEIERWREVLARNIALRSPDISQRELNFAVQQTIDRIVFLRICEDRGIENYGRLMALQNGADVYARLFQLFREADEKYNSGLFHFKKEKGRENFDNLTPGLNIDDKVLKDIFKNLYYPDSPYEFSVLPTDILGQVYEKFLGKVIRLTAGHQAKIEEKPEVRKAGGVYYTPTYIVAYIVKNTVGKLLEDKKPGPRGGVNNLRVLDPACGSGSFLIGAYQFLLDWHLDQYVNAGPEKWINGRTPTLYQSHKGEWRLTTDERKRILLNNIYGVDIDHHAVEVTKLSLLLKVLEGEDEQSIGKQMALFHERVLPDLSNNIKCGNSLIGPDFYDNQQMNIFDEEEMYRVNVFDWNAEFVEIMKEGGFDAVIGNPPYVFGRDWKALGISDNVKAYLTKSYSASPYQKDLFSIFMDKASRLACISGHIGMIVPNVWLGNMYSAPTRAFILNNATDLTIAVPMKPVFPELTVDTIVYNYQKAKKTGDKFSIISISETSSQLLAQLAVVDYLDGKSPISTSAGSGVAAILNRLQGCNTKLADLAKITRGIHPYRTGGYGQTAFGSGPQTDRDVKERPYHSLDQKEGYRRFVYGKNLRRHSPVQSHEFINYGPWIAEPRTPEFFEGSRIYSRKILGTRLVVTLERADSVADQQVYITKPITGNEDVTYLCGILGSALMAFYIRHYFDEVNDAFPQIKVGQLKSLPIRTIDFGNPPDKVAHDQMVSLVNNMLDLNKKLTESKIPQAIEVLKRQLDSTDKQIDHLVYNLYDLTDEEIKIVESET